MKSRPFAPSGEFDTDRGSWSRTYARLSFIQAIARNAGRVFEELHVEPLNRYRETDMPQMMGFTKVFLWEIYVACGDPRYCLDGVLRYPYASYAAQERQCDKERLPALFAVRDTLRTWARGYNIDVGWMLHYAFLKLDSYVCSADKSEHTLAYRWCGYTDCFGAGVQPEMDFARKGGMRGRYERRQVEPFEVALSMWGWNPFLLNREEFERIAREMFDRHLKNYLDRQEEQIKSEPGVEQAITEYPPEAFDWLAAYQTDSRATFASVACDAGVTAKTVKSQITELAALISLPLRAASKGGRKRGSRDQGPARRRVR
jgi:hypothetical protein